MKRAKFKVFIAHDGKWVWRLVAANGEIICHSEGYESVQMCRKGIQAARKAAVFGVVEED